MYRNKLFVTLLSGALATGTLLGTAAIAGAREPQSRPHHGQMGMMKDGPRGEAWRAVAFVRMLKQFDTDQDGKISKNEGTAGVEAIFSAIDTNNDGSITPGEFRAYRQAETKKMREARVEKADDAATAPSGDQQQAADDARPSSKAKHDGADRRDGRKGMANGGRMLASLMGQVDTDENGQVSRQEASAAFDKFFASMDTNKDGFVSIEDFPDRPFL